MRKKFMLVAALAGILSLGACVDDKESASVEAIRNAKAEQLKSVAAMNNATAEATKLAAEAQAALDAIAAELAKVQLDEEKARIAVELAGQEQKLEAALLEAQAKLAIAKQDYLDALKDADEQAVTRLKGLLSNYTTAANELIGLKGDLVKEKNKLIGLEYDLVSAEAAKEQTTITAKRNIANQEAMIAAYEKYASANKDEAYSAYLKADSEAKVLANAATATNEKITVANTDLTTTDTKLSNSAYYRKLADMFIGKGYANLPIRYDYNDEFYYYDVEDEFGNTNKVILFTDRITEYTDVEYVNDDQTAGYPMSYSTITDFYTVKKDGFDSYIAAFEKYIKDNQAKAVKDAQKDYDDAAEDEADAKEAAEATGATQQDKDDYIAAHNTTLAMKDVLDAATDALNDINEELAEVKAAYAFLTSKEQTDAVKAWVDSYNALSKGICDLSIQYNKENYVAGLKSAEVTALNAIYTGAVDPADLILGCKSAIANYEKQIADMGSVITKEDAIEVSKGQITKIETEIAAKEKEVALTKAAFEAAANA